MNDRKRIKTIRFFILIFIAGLFISGLTAIPLQAELQLLAGFVKSNNLGSWLTKWILDVQGALADTGDKYPFLFYGTDWLAFAHFVIAILFIGPLLDPQKNIWVIQFGMIACILLIPYALLSGHFREIPLYWRFADCLFGIFGFIILAYIHKHIHKLNIR
ncbi:MAG: hypothetical protein ABIJ16_03415 [Bacteroidota bacterium]